MHHTPLKKLLFVTVLLPLVALLATSARAQTAVRERVSLDADWRFIKDDPAGAGAQLGYAAIKDTLIANAAGAELVVKSDPKNTLGNDVSYAQPSFNDSSWRSLNLPHDWGIEGPFSQALPGSTGRLPWAGIAWYRKTFKLPANFSGKQVFLDVDGAMSFPNVWVNGHYAGGWPYGYNSFQIDVTPYVKADGDNVIAIRLDNPPLSSRWYPGGGIYRNVWLEAADPVHVAHWGTYVTTPDITKDSATVNVQVTVDNQSAASANATVQTQIYALGPDGKITGAPVAGSNSAALKIDANGSQIAPLTLKVANPKLWGLQEHNLYAAVTTIQQGGRTVDSTQTNFGIRTIKFDPDKGFFLNGEHVRINGVCDHGDLGPLGIATNTRALERQIEILQEMGCNAIRTSHNMPPPELLDLCDRMGILVMDESFDTWENPKDRNVNDYSLLFADWHEKDIRAEVRRDRNHPSVILWSIGNEIGQQGTARGNEIALELTKIVHQEDPTRMTATANNNPPGFSGLPLDEYAYGENYKPYLYASFHANNPGEVVFGSETASTLSSRGTYVFPPPPANMPPPPTALQAPRNPPKYGQLVRNGQTADWQVSDFGLYWPSWATTPDDEFAGQDNNPASAGEFVWTGFDYIGEPTPFGNNNDPARSSYFGIVDLDGFKKDRFYEYQAHWRPDFPMAHILPHWNWPDRVGQVTAVHVFTTGDEAELFLNGKSLGRKQKGKDGQNDYRLRWDDVVYAPGELKVVAYKNGKEWASDTVKTTGPAAKVAITPDRTAIKADGQDLSFVTVSIKDKDGLTVPTAMNKLHYDITGPGEIVAVDNGDPTSLAPIQGASDSKAFNGLALVIIRGKPGQSGKITLTAKSDGLDTGSTNIASAAATP